MGAETSTIDVRGAEPSAKTLEEAERVVNQIVLENRPVHLRYRTADELAQLGVRKQVDRSGVLRAVEIEGIDLQPCGGTHVKSSGQIGAVLLRRFNKIRQDWRIEFVCGWRALRAARNEYSLLRQTAETLSCAPEEVVSATQRVWTERDANFKTLRSVLQQLAEAETKLAAQTTPPDCNELRIVTRVFDETVQPEFPSLFAAELGKVERTIALLARAASGEVFFSQHPSAGKDMNGLLKQVFQQFGGKGGGNAHSARGRLENGTNAQAAVDWAANRLR
jgi:alanyl-tRNA synthetase